MYNFICFVRRAGKPYRRVLRVFFLVFSVDPAATFDDDLPGPVLVVLLLGPRVIYGTNIDRENIGFKKNIRRGGGGAQ